jgi:hypothetical protein
MSAIHYLINRMNTYPLFPENKSTRTEYELLKMKAVYKKSPTPGKSSHHISPNEQRIKWSTFTYFVPGTRMITKIFRNTNIKEITLRTSTTIQHHLKPRETTDDIYNLTSIYLLTC